MERGGEEWMGSAYSSRDDFLLRIGCPGRKEPRWTEDKRKKPHSMKKAVVT